MHASRVSIEICSLASCSFFLAYSPDFNPIEQCWAMLKTALRQAQARTRQALDAALK